LRDCIRRSERFQKKVNAVDGAIGSGEFLKGGEVGHSDSPTLNYGQPQRSQFAQHPKGAAPLRMGEHDPLIRFRSSVSESLSPAMRVKGSVMRSSHIDFES